MKTKFHSGELAVQARPGLQDKAVYAYPAEHYDHWRGELYQFDLLIVHNEV